LGSAVQVPGAGEAKTLHTPGAGEAGAHDLALFDACE